MTTSKSALTVGMLEIAPVAGFRVSPAGRAPPITANVYGATPPLGVMVCKYATALTAGGRIDGEPMIGGQSCEPPPLVMHGVYCTVPVQPFVSVTVTVIGKQPVWVGVPQSMPPLVNVRPLGSAPVDENVGTPRIPVAVKVSQNGVPVVPVVVTGGITVIGWHWKQIM